jgi:MOSC domain-containing protein YiiM
MKGRILSLHIADAGGAPMQTVERAMMVSGRGIRGDRYYYERGTWSKHPGSGRQVTLIENEALETLQREHRITIGPALARRNIVTIGIALNHLVGREFRIGEIRLRGMRLCDPCAHLEKLSVSGALRALVHRGGLRADILSDGVVRAGEPVTIAPDDSA